MSVIKGKGSDAKQLSESNGLSKKDSLIMLKDGDSVNLYVPSVENYVAYGARGDFNLGIFSQPVDEDSPLKVAFEKGGEPFSNLYEQTRFLFMFIDVDTQKPVGFQASKKQARNLISTIEQYEEEEVLNEQPFKLSRTGTKAETSYTLSPVLSKKQEIKDKFAEAKEVEIKDEYYENLLEPNQDAFVAKLLKDCGFDVATHLPHISIKDDDGDEGAVEEIESNSETSDDDLLDEI